MMRPHADNKQMILGACLMLVAISGRPADANLPTGTTAALTAATGNYARSCEPPIENAFIPLPPGAVEPAGWLRDWAKAAAAGITGHLDEYHSVFRDAWKGTPVQAPNAAPDGTGWPLEQCSYWLDGLVRLGYVLHDETLIRKAKERLDLVVDGVNRGGTSFIYWATNPPSEFNSWAHSHMGRALVAYYEATGDRRILDALEKAYRSYPVPMGTLDLTNVNVSGLCNLDAMLETYSFTGDRSLFERVRAAMDRPEVQASINDWLAGRFNPCHAVCFDEIIRLPALIYPWAGERKYLDASRKAFQWLGDEHLLPYGATSGGEFLSGVGAFHLTETCDVSASLWSGLWMYRITGEGSWGDDLEREFFNAAAEPIARDFQTMCYYQSPNRLQPETLPGGHPLCPGPGCLKFTRLGYPGVLCCVGNMNRLIPNYVIHMWMATHDEGLAATLYGPCTVKGFVGHHLPVRLDCQTTYPFDDIIRIRVAPDLAATFPLYFRVPDWCHAPKISVNNARTESVSDQHGFVRIERTWKPGDSVTLEFPMSVRITRGFEMEFPAANREYFGYMQASVFQKKRLPYESVSFGPLLFALPIPDLDPNTVAPDARWKFALDNSPRKKGRDITIERHPMPARWDWPLAAPIVLKVPAKAFDWNPTEAQALPEAPVNDGKSETISLIPYGCTKFHVTMFPVTAQAWKNPPKTP
ncbi:MAG: beta-L-arabinofuranosidase domain-containing protein [Verrucomicrobiota bacterium]|jgi:hypothetical protein